MTTIIFEAHSTSKDNEARLSSGWNDVELSELGTIQSKQLGERYELRDFDAVFVSDLERSIKTATLAFDVEPNKLFIDWRLRECDYGDLTQHPKDEVDSQKPHRVTTPFPNGESYEQSTHRMGQFLQDLLLFHEGETVLMIGHRATQYGLEHLINKIPLTEVLSAPWKWQPGWKYELASQSSMSN